MYIVLEYKGAIKYYNEDNFDHDAFWEYMRKISNDNLVFISELQCPDDFVSIWQKSLNRKLNKNNMINSTENLFVHKPLLEKYNLKPISKE